MRATRTFFLLALSLVVLGAAGLIAGATWTPSPAVAASPDSGWLGVMLSDLTSDIRTEYGIDRRVDGALITRVLPDSPAERAGLKKGDVIVELDNQRVASVDEVVRTARALVPGEKVLLVVDRNGTSRGLSIRPGDRSERRFAFFGDDRPVPDSDREVRRHFRGSEKPHPPRVHAPHAPRVPLAPRAPKAPRVWEDDDGRTIVLEGDEDDGDEGRIHVYRKGDKPRVWVHKGDDDERRVRIHRDEDRGDRVRVRSRTHGGFLGVETQNLDDQLAAYFEVEGGQGVLITEIVEDSPAEKAGLSAGDVIVAVDGESAKSTGDLRRLVRAHDPEEAVDVEIVRRGAQKRVEVRLADVSDFSDGGWSAIPDMLAEQLRFDGDGPIRVFDLELPDLDELESLEALEGLEGLQALDDLDLDITIPDIRIPDLDIEIEGLDPEDMEELRERLDEYREQLHEHGIELREHFNDEDGRIRIQLEEGMLRLQEHLDELRDHLHNLRIEERDHSSERREALEKTRQALKEAQHERQRALQEAMRGREEALQPREERLRRSDELLREARELMRQKEAGKREAKRVREDA